MSPILLLHHLQQLQTGNMEGLYNSDKLHKGQERQMLLILSVMIYSVTQCQDDHGRLLVFSVATVVCTALEIRAGQDWD